ncbi:MAG: MBL fold metallo-hydrolase [Oscillospiraceae bacterium]|nr:MBL fold metallo-hydrolase [Oscillospiraceae bacterium]
MIKLKYGNTNTFFVNGLLIDTDYAGTLPAFFKAIKSGGIVLSDILFVFATHYHPDHVGLISELTELGVRLLLMEHQMPFVHFSDEIFGRDLRLVYKPIDESGAVVIRCEESREFLRELGIDGEIVPTVSHSGDGAALILDSGECFVGDLEPLEYLGAYKNNHALKKDWELLMSHCPKVIYYGHANEKILK